MLTGIDEVTFHRQSVVHSAVVNEPLVHAVKLLPLEAKLSACFFLVDVTGAATAKCVDKWSMLSHQELEDASSSLCEVSVGF